MIWIDMVYLTYIHVITYIDMTCAYWNYMDMHLQYVLKVCRRYRICRSTYPILILPFPFFSYSLYTLSLPIHSILSMSMCILASWHQSAMQLSHWWPLVHLLGPWRFQTPLRLGRPSGRDLRRCDFGMSHDSCMYCITNDFFERVESRDV